MMSAAVSATRPRHRFVIRSRSESPPVLPVRRMASTVVAQAS